MHDGRIIVLKLRKNGLRDIPTEHEIKAADFNLDDALDWCRENGYTVHNWRYGARAWKGEPWAIRTMHQIIKLRRRLETESLSHWEKRTAENHSANHHPGERWHQVKTLLQLDLAFDG
jgi:hypothetical protein